MGRIGALALLLLLSASASARIVHNESWAREKFAAAEHLREELNSRPEKDRTRHNYQRVIDAYRRIYLGCPTCAKADPSVVASAELLLQMGRQFEDDDILRSAIKQFQFLRREYPGSKSRLQALFTIAEIYKDDLDQPQQARTAFEEFLRRYPHSRLADDAVDAVTELNQTAHHEADDEPSDLRSSPKLSDEAKAPGASEEDKHGKYTRITGILHWESADSARVAIDLEQEVQFNSERLKHPTRIYFDLHDTRLAAGLKGKTFDVQSALLKKIRMAQFERGRSRIVLEVDSQSEYRAFLLPNPNRLIIEIHAAKEAKTPSNNDQTNASAGKQQVNPADNSRRTPPVGSAESRSRTSPILQTSAENKSPLAVEEETPVRKIIVEADDDDDDSSSTAIAKPAESKRAAITSAATRKRAQSAAPAASTTTHKKRRSADGNDDEIATLNPPELKTDASSASRAAFPPLTRSSGRAKTKQSQPKQDSAEVDMREAQPTLAGDRSLIRALGLKIGRIVIDPGHGGHDTGTIGPNGVQEKTVVLDVALRLGKLLQARMGADVVYTRQNDTFIPLETRTAIANQEQADLFVSIHANSSRDEDARGVETYYLNFTSNPAALEVAARENAASDKSIHELQDLVKKIALKEKIEESREFATDVQRSLHSGLAGKNPGIRDRGVKKAPFVVLIGANMPSILAEISFVSNPTDARKLQTAEYRQRIAESLYKGISKYVSGLSGIRVARSRMAKSDGQ